MAEPKHPKAANLKPIEKATNRPWQEWMAFMQLIGAKDLGHKQIAQKVMAELQGLQPTVSNPGWWAQGITVAYEQQSGRRLPGQQADGTFQTSASKTTVLGMQQALDAWVSFAVADAEVAKVVGSEPRIGGTDKRKTWRANAADGSALLVASEPRPNGKSAIVITHTKLPSQEKSAEAKEFWAGALQRFVATL